MRNTLLPAKVRYVIYVGTAAGTAAYGVIEANADPHWAWRAGWAAVVTAANALAASHTDRSSQ